MATYRIRHSHGLTEYVEGTYEDALDAIRAVYTHAEIGHAGDISEGGARTLCWASEELAQDDDGSRACATIDQLHD